MEPVARVLAALEGGLDVAVVLEVVADDERGAVLAGAAAAERWPVPKASMVTPLRRTMRPRRQTGPRPTASGIVAGEERVVEELGFEVFEVGVGLVLGVGDDPDVGLAGFEGFAEGIGEGGEGGLGAAAGAEDVELSCRAIRGHAVELLGHPLVHGGRGLWKWSGK